MARYFPCMTSPTPAHPRGLAFIDGLAARGRASFTTEEAQRALGGGVRAVQAMLRRLRSRAEIATPVRGFHVILSPEHRAAGCRPGMEFIDDLASWLETPYYVALLSAAELHGAAHQRPQVDQVIVPNRHRDLRCGNVRVDFVVRENARDIPTVVKNTPTGTVRVATPEATALDLVGYVDHCGGLGNIATVLKELAEEISAPRLVEVLGTSPTAWGQRLGYLLDLVGASHLADAVEPAVAAERPVWTPLDPQSHRSGARLQRWRLVLNQIVEPDL